MSIYAKSKGDVDNRTLIVLGVLGKWISLEKIEDKPMDALSTKEEKWDGKSRHSKAEKFAV